MKKATEPRDAPLPTEKLLSHSLLAAIGALAMEWTYLENELLHELLHAPALADEAFPVRELSTHGSWIVDLYAEHFDRLEFSAAELEQMPRPIDELRELVQWKDKILSTPWVQPAREGAAHGTLVRAGGDGETWTVTPAFVRKAALTIAAMRNALASSYRRSHARADLDAAGSRE